MRSHVAVANTLNTQRLRDGGPPKRWLPYEPEWSVFLEAYAELQALADQISYRLPPVAHCWIYHVWRHGRGFEPAGQRSDRYHLMYELVAGEPLPDGMVPDHLCGGGRFGCINPFHLRVVTPYDNSQNVRYDPKRFRWVDPPKPLSFSELINFAKETAA